MMRFALPTVLASLALTVGARSACAQAPQPPDWHAAVDSLVEAELARTGTPGAQVAIALDGEVIYTRGYGHRDAELALPVTERTLFRVGSVTKMVAGLTLATLAERGQLDLQAPIARYVTELEGRRVGTVTTHQLLTHTAGWMDQALPYGRSGAGALGEVMVEVTDTLFFTEPGRVTSYSNPGYSMAGYVGERAGGRRFAALVESLVLRPLGMQRATFDPLQAMTWDFSQGHVGPPGRPAGVVRPYTHNSAQSAAGFLFASAAEMAQVAIALMDSGRLNGEQVLPANAVAEVVAPHVPVPGLFDASYGYGITQPRLPNGLKVWQHGGSINGFDALVTMFPAQRLAIVLLDNRNGPSVNGFTEFVARRVADLELPQPPAIPERRAATPAERAALLGRYGAGRMVVELRAQGDSLQLLQNGVPSPVWMRGGDAIEVVPPAGPPQLLVLVRDGAGRVTHLSFSMRALARLP